MDDVVISAHGLGKMYRIGSRGPGHRLEMYNTLREKLSNKALSFIHGGSFVPVTYDELWALKDITFDIGKGEIVGIVGKNGAGKSTLLKVLSKITTPSEGYVDIDGNIGSLLEIGPGFHSELSGRENIYLYGAILGMKKKDINDKFDEIVQFSGIQEFIDTPLKRYSSGMWIRLGFGIVSVSHPDVMFLDETLSVSDVGFQTKALNKVRELSKEGCAVLCVSHNETVIRSICTRAILLKDGKNMYEGSVDDVYRAYSLPLFS